MGDLSLASSTIFTIGQCNCCIFCSIFKLTIINNHPTLSDQRYPRVGLSTAAVLVVMPT